MYGTELKFLCSNISYSYTYKSVKTFLKRSLIGYMFIKNYPKKLLYGKYISQNFTSYLGEQLSD